MPNHTSPDSTVLGEQIDEILEKLLPIPFQGYNQGLLPDEEGYSSPVLEIQYRVEERREEAKAALLQLIAQERTEAKLDAFYSITKEMYRSDMTVPKIYTHCLLSIQELEAALRAEGK